MATARRGLLAALLSIAFGFSVAVAQIATPLTVTREANLPKAVDEIVRIGGPSDRIQCDNKSNLWIPALRGYSSTVSSVVRYAPNGQFSQFDIDKFRDVRNGSIEGFLPLNSGGVLVLARTVAEYTKIYGRPSSPKRYAETFAVTFTAPDTSPTVTKLEVSPDTRITALAPLRNGWLGAAYSTHDSGKAALIEVEAFIFDEHGKVTKRIDLPQNRHKSSQSGRVETMSVYRPTAVISADGSILVFRGLTNQPVYRFDDHGQLLGTVKLLPDGIEFWSGRLIGNSLLVEADVPPESTGESVAGIPVVRSRSAFLNFDMNTGAITEVFTWMDYGTVGCFDGNRFTIVQEARGNSDTWKILTLEPQGSRAERPKT